MPRYLPGARPLFQKPLRGSTLDIGHPLARGMVFCCAFNEGTGAEGLCNLALRPGGKTPVRINGSAEPTWIGSRYGMAAHAPGTSGGAIKWTDAAGWGFASTSDPISVAVWGQLNSGFSPTTYWSFASVNGLWFLDSGGNNHYNFTGNSSLSGPNGERASGAYNMLLGTFDGGIVSSLYLNGVLDAQNTSGFVSGTPDGTIVLNDCSTAGLFQDYLLACVWNRRLRDDEAAQLYARPYDFLTPPPFRRWYSTVTIVHALSVADAATPSDLLTLVGQETRADASASTPQATEVGQRNAADSSAPGDAWTTAGQPTGADSAPAKGATTASGQLVGADQAASLETVLLALLAVTLVAVDQASALSAASLLAGITNSDLPPSFATPALTAATQAQDAPTSLAIFAPTGVLAGADRGDALSSAQLSLVLLVMIIAGDLATLGASSAWLAIASSVDAQAALGAGSDASLLAPADRATPADAGSESSLLQPQDSTGSAGASTWIGQRSVADSATDGSTAAGSSLASSADQAIANSTRVEVGIASWSDAPASLASTSALVSSSTMDRATPSDQASAIIALAQTSLDGALDAASFSAALSGADRADLADALVWLISSVATDTTLATGATPALSAVVNAMTGADLASSRSAASLIAQIAGGDLPAARAGAQALLAATESDLAAALSTSPAQAQLLSLIAVVIDRRRDAVTRLDVGGGAVVAQSSGSGRVSR